MSRDPVTLRLIADSLLYASEEMGLALRNSSYSPNIKERMDHSAAVFDSEGRLLAQAEHIPVHLGSLPWGLAKLLARCRRDGIPLEGGSMVASNDPYLTGTHLNDVTVLAPVLYGGRLVAFVVNKAHHSDVGGRVPGSISMEARELSDEGYVMEPSVLWRGGDFNRAVLDGFASASRTPAERRGDLKAQVAANVTGVRRIASLTDRYGIGLFVAAATNSFRHSESLTTARLARFRKGTSRASDFLEGPNGEDLTLRVKVTVSGTGIDVDYGGTSPQVDYPLNAVFGVTLSGVYFVARCLVGADIPANHGAFSRIGVRAPRGTILNPTRPHPVAGGNVETSQRNADVVFRALARALPTKVPAASGGSMNNVMIGGVWHGTPWAFYETIGVGLGGSSQKDGLDGIQANMTNTMNTPIEEMERSLPVRIVRYEFREGSSGAGEKRGGSGLIRSYMVLSPDTTFTVLAERERHKPWGLGGGLSGAGTEVYLERGASRTLIPVKSTLALREGDVLEVRTAGGGGHGPPKLRRRQKVEADLMNGLISPAAAKTDYGVALRKRP